MLRSLALGWFVVGHAVASGVMAFAQAMSIPPDELVRQSIAREVTAANAGGHLMYRQVKVTPRGSETWAIIETRDWTIGRLIGIDGEPLSPARQRAETDRLNALRSDSVRVRDLQENLYRDEQRVRRIMAAMPDAFEYTRSASDTSEAGRPVIRLTFRPRASFDPSSRELAVLTGMEGTMLIDSAARRVVRIEATLVRDVSFGWGVLGRLNRGGHFLLEQRNVVGDRWAITELTFHLEGRVLLFKPVTFNASARATGFTPMGDDLTLEEGIARLLRESVPTPGAVLRQFP